MRTFSLLTSVLIALASGSANAPDARLVGNWYSGAFIFEFAPDGRYAYAGEVGGAGLMTRLAEQGNYAADGASLIVDRTTGSLASSNGYTQSLNPERTIYRYTLLNTQSGPGMQVIYPNGGVEIFYRR
jgi:hypothetical protein